MKLSMWILADWLKKYHPIAKIESGEAVLRSVRILTAEKKPESHIVYLAPAKEYIPSESKKIICVHERDMILLDAEDLDLVLNDIFDAFDYYNGWSDGMIRDIQNGCDLQHLVDAGHQAIGQPMMIFDANHMVTAYTKQYLRGTLDPEWDVMLETKSVSLEALKRMKEHLHRSQFTHSPEILDFPFFNERSLQRMLFRGRFANGRLIVLEINERITPAMMQIVDSFGRILEAWMEHNEKNEELKEESAIFCDILEGKSVSFQKLNYKLNLVGWKPEHEKALFMIKIPHSHQMITYPLLHTLKRNFETCYVFLCHEAIFLLSNLVLKSYPDIGQRLIAILYQSGVCCSVSYFFQDMRQLAVCEEQCRFTLQCAPGEKGHIYRCQEYAFDYLKNLLSTQISRAVIHPALQQIKSYDARTKNALYATLKTYLDCSCNLVQAAKILNLHRNSMLYRMHKIEEITGLQLDDTDVRIYLIVSYLIDGKEKTER